MFVVGCVGGEELFILQQFAAFLGWYQRTLSRANEEPVHTSKIAIYKYSFYSYIHHVHLFLSLVPHLTRSLFLGSYEFLKSSIIFIIFGKDSCSRVCLSCLD